MNTTDFIIDEKNFEYEVQHMKENNGTYIKCIHKDDFYVWSLYVSDNVIAKSDNLNFVITPLHLFNLLLRYKNATLDKMYDFKFQETYDTHDSVIVLELHFKLPHDSLNIIVPFCLRKNIVPESERFDKKLLKLKATMTTDYRNDIAPIKDAINKLSESERFDEKLLELKATMTTDYKNDIALIKETLATDYKNDIALIKETLLNSLTAVNSSKLIPQWETLTTDYKNDQFVKKYDTNNTFKTSRFQFNHKLLILKKNMQTEIAALKDEISKLSESNQFDKKLSDLEKNMTTNYHNEIATLKNEIITLKNEIATLKKK